MTPEELQLSVLAAIWGTGPERDGWVFLPYIDGSAQTKAERRKAYHEGPAFKWPEQRDAILDHLRQHQDDDLYYCPNVFNGKKRAAELVNSERVTYADLDDTYDPDRLDELPPSIRYHTSDGKEQAVWLMKGTRTGATWRGDVNHRLTVWLGADPSGWDSTQLLRVPGRNNHKYSPPQRGWLDYARGKIKYSWSDLDDHLADVEVDVYEGDGIIDDQLINGIDHDQLWAQVRKEHKGNKKFNKLSQLKNSRSNHSDRSDRVWEMARLLDELSHTPAEAFVIIEPTVWAEDRTFKRLKQDITNAYAKVATEQQAAADEEQPDEEQAEFPANVAAAIAQVHAGVTVESAAQANNCKVATLRQALEHPAARKINPTKDWDAVDLLRAKFNDTPDIWEGIAPVGVTLVSAAPKVGKTRLLTQLSVSAVRGSPFLNRAIAHTKVLHLVLEDGARRYRKALENLVGDDWPERGELVVRTTSARLDEGGLEDIEKHLDANPDCKLVIIDVLARVRPRGQAGGDKYQLDYDALAELHKAANRRQMAIVVVHHNNQREDVKDVFELVSGTSGLIGVVDSLVVVQRRRGDGLGLMSVTGREVEDKEIPLSFRDGWWDSAPRDMPIELLTERSEIRVLWFWLADMEVADTEELAKQYGRSKDATLKVLRRLEDKGLVDSLSAPAPSQPVRWRVVRGNV